MTGQEWVFAIMLGCALGYLLARVMHRPNPHNAIALQQAADALQQSTAELKRERDAHEATTLRCSDAEARLAQISLLAAPRS